MLRRVLNLLNHFIFRRSVGFLSCVVGLFCYALSSSFKSLFGEWNPTKIILYILLSSLISIVVLFAGKSRVSGISKLKAHVEYLVLMLTSLYSFFADQSTKGKPDTFSVVSSGAFALTSLCLSRQIELGFQVGLFSFFLGYLTVQLMKIHLIFILVAAGFCYPLVVFRSYSDSQSEIGDSSSQENLVIQIDGANSAINQQTDTSTVLTPNYVIQPSNSASTFSQGEGSEIENLVHKLAFGNPEEQRSAAGEIRLLAKRNTDNRTAIAEAGAIPLLVNLLSITDSRTQEHAITALLNLSILENNKASIMSSGAVPGIVHVLNKGNMEARENAAATLYSLAVIDENKVTIGSSEAIPALVTLLTEGTKRGKKDAATALFNLCIYQGNKGKAVRAGVVPTLMRLLTEHGGGMVDEALSILAILASHPEGKIAIGDAEAVPVLVGFIGNGSPRNKENATAVLAHLCSGDHSCIAQALDLGVTGPLLDLAQNGSHRGKRKAEQLLERRSRFLEQQQKDIKAE